MLLEASSGCTLSCRFSNGRPSNLRIPVPRIRRVHRTSSNMIKLEKEAGGTRMADGSIKPQDRRILELKGTCKSSSPAPS